MKTYHCGCGLWMNESCNWSGPIKEMVVVEYMPEYLRESHRACGNSGCYGHNGSVRVAVEKSCAKRLANNEFEFVVKGLDPTPYAEEC